MQKHLPQQAWQRALTNAITDPAELLQILKLDPALLAPAKKAQQLFGLRVTRSYVSRMQKGNPHDPLLRQVLPLAEELHEHPGYFSDPLAEKQANPLPGVLHKYHGRVLLTIAGSCSINCRFCFRREFPYQDNNPGQAGWDKVIAYLQQQPDITEVILSGGDPLIASDVLLENLGKKLLTIPHLKTLRIHTRVPIVLPERITTNLLSWLKNYPLRKVLVLHCNHPQELTPEINNKLARLQQAGITLLNQSVLLKSINNNATTLIQLSEKLFEAGVLPYYLHVLDKVRGTAHFDIAEQEAKSLIKNIQAYLPGYLVPRLVREQAGEKSKVLISVT